jgi:phage tail-like protein
MTTPSGGADVVVSPTESAGQAALYVPERSTYLQLLPGIYQDSDFLGRFLLIFESILTPMDRMVGSIHHYFDPDVAPPETLRWVASWLGIVLDERWPEDRQRDLVRGATDLYRWRGTRRGLSTVLRLATGITPTITEATVSDVQADPSRAFRFGVHLAVPRGQDIDRKLIEAIIDLEKPAWVACDLEIVAKR